MLLYMNYQSQQQTASDTYQIKYFNNLSLINDYEELNDNDPDFNFYNAMSQNRSCNYYLESSFNDMINKSKEKGTFSLCHLNIRSMKKNITNFE